MMSNEAQDNRMKRTEEAQRDGGKAIGNEKLQGPALKSDAHQNAKLSNTNGLRAPSEKKQEEVAEPKPSKLKTLWRKLGLDPGTLMMMFKFVPLSRYCTVTDVKEGGLYLLSLELHSTKPTRLQSCFQLLVTSSL